MALPSGHHPRAQLPSQLCAARRTRRTRSSLPHCRKRPVAGVELTACRRRRPPARRGHRARSLLSNRPLHSTMGRLTRLVSATLLLVLHAAAFRIAAARPEPPEIAGATVPLLPHAGRYLLLIGGRQRSNMLPNAFQLPCHAGPAAAVRSRQVALPAATLDCHGEPSALST